MSSQGDHYGQGYTHGQEGNLLAEGTGQAGRGLAEAAAVLMMAAQMAARIREQKANARVEDDQAETDRRQAQLRIDHAQDRVRWAPALDPGFSPSESTAVSVWTSAQPWQDNDRAAAEAASRAEQRLEELHPELMAEYRSYRDQGMEPPEAMLEAGRAVSAPQWQDVLDPARRQEMDVDATLRVWDAARPWATPPDGLASPYSVEAAQAMALAEDRLRTIRPGAMSDYDDRRAMGEAPVDAMRAVLPEMRSSQSPSPAGSEPGAETEAPAKARASLAEGDVAGRAQGPGSQAAGRNGSGALAGADEYGSPAHYGPPALDTSYRSELPPSYTDLVSQSYPQALGRGDLGGAEAAQTVADDQRAEASRDFSTRDNLATPQDERSQGTSVGAENLEHAEAGSSKASTLANQSFPTPLQGATVRATTRTTTHAPAPSPAAARRR